MTPTARSLTLLRRCGHHAEVVERWIPRANVRKDLFGCIDLVAVRRGEQGVLAIQATSRPNIGARVKKAQGKPALGPWLAAGNRFEVWGWYQRDDGRWDVVRVAVNAGDLSAETVEAPRARRRRKNERQAALPGMS